MPRHSAQTAATGIHVVQSYEYANAAARTGATGFVAADIGKVARQTDNQTFWILTATTPTWIQLGAGGSDIFAKVSANDTTAGYLNGKLVAGSNVTLTEQNDGGNETLSIAATGEANTAANVGAGSGVFRDKTGTTINLKSLVQGASMLLTAAADTITIALGSLSATFNAANFAITAMRTATFNAENNVGNSGASANVDWTVAQKQRVTLTANATLTFTAPNGPGNFLLRVIQDATGGRSVTWPATVRWPSGTAPAIQAGAANSIHVVSLYYDGTNYYAVGSLNFS